MSITMDISLNPCLDTIELVEPTLLRDSYESGQLSLQPYIEKYQKVPKRFIHGRIFCGSELFQHDKELDKNLLKHFDSLNDLEYGSSDLSTQETKTYSYVIDKNTSDEFCDTQEYWFKSDASLSAAAFRLDHGLLEGHTTHILCKEMCTQPINSWLKHMLFLTIELYFTGYSCRSLENCDERHLHGDWDIRMLSFVSCTFDKMIQGETFKGMFDEYCAKLFLFLGYNDAQSKSHLKHFWRYYYQGNEELKYDFKSWINPINQQWSCVQALNLRNIWRKL